jgi:hypothetical protein
VRSSVWRNPFAFLFATKRRDQYVEQYVLREYRKGRPFAEILDDPYVRAWSTPEERVELLQRPSIIAAVGDHAIAALQAAVTTSAVSPAQTTGSRR